MTARRVTALMDNVLAWRLGQAARETAEGSAGDFIDTGLILLRELEQRGFVLSYTGPEFPGSHEISRD